MSGAMLMERGAFTSSMPGNSMGPTTAMPGMMPGANMCMVPRCTMQVEKCKGGIKIHCRCEDEVACATLQNLCKMMAGGMCSCICTMNGITMIQCNLTCGMCKCEYTEDGVCITCTSGDKGCCEMLQSCCDTIACCMQNSCCCYVCFNGNPVCCAC